jgi:3-oxoacyl-[acyl-carrier protein] reductase
MDEPAARERAPGRRLEGAVAIVTGSGHGIGVAYARHFADAGAAVVVADLDAPAAEKVAASIQEDGGRALAVGVDISDERATSELARAAVAEFGKITVLVNNAAMFSAVPMSRGGFADITVDEWDRMMQVNVKGTWLVSRAVVPHMRAAKYGKIINISSTTAIRGSDIRAHYVTAKAALLGLTKSLARELGKDGITVNCVAPGGTLSEENPDDASLARRQGSIGSRSIPRVQVPADLVGTVAFLASPDSDFVTGQTIVVDGGSVML